MQYYYDINLHFDDYYINYYEWSEFEHFNRLPIFKVESIKVFLENNVSVETEYKNMIISDGITSLGLEIIDDKVVYISSLPYEDEFKINRLVMNGCISLEYNIINKKDSISISSIGKVKERFLTILKNANNDLIKLLYYEITGKISNNYTKMIEYLENDIRNNFSNQYYQLYDMIMIGD